MKSSFKKLLETHKSVPIDIENLQVLETEMFNIYRNISPPIVRQLFQPRNNDYNFRQFLQFDLPNVRNVFLWNRKYFIPWSENLEYCSK